MHRQAVKRAHAAAGALVASLGANSALQDVMVWEIRPRPAVPARAPQAALVREGRSRLTAQARVRPVGMELERRHPAIAMGFALLVVLELALHPAKIAMERVRRAPKVAQAPVHVLPQQSHQPQNRHRHQLSRQRVSQHRNQPQSPRMHQPRMLH